MAGVRAENMIAEFQHASVGAEGFANECAEAHGADGWIDEESVQHINHTGSDESQECRVQHQGLLTARRTF